MAHQEYPAEWVEAFKGYSKLSYPEQAKVFLRAFFMDDNVDVEEVWGLMKSFAAYGDASHTELEENQAHKFLQDQGNAISAIQLRNALRRYDVDRNNKVSFVEYCMLHFDKDMAALMTNDIDGDPALLAKLASAKDDLKQHDEHKLNLEAKIRELETVVAAGGVKKFAAQQEIEKITQTFPEHQHQRDLLVKALAKAQKDVDDHGSELDKILFEKGLH